MELELLVVVSEVGAEEAPAAGMDIHILSNLGCLHLDRNLWRLCPYIHKLMELELLVVVSEVVTVVAEVELPVEE